MEKFKVTDFCDCWLLVNHIEYFLQFILVFVAIVTKYYKLILFCCHCNLASYQKDISVVWGKGR